MRSWLVGSNTVESITANIVIIGGGPAGLMAAEVIGQHCLGSTHSVQLFDAMPSVGRKFLLAGRGGLNITHAEAQESFLSRYGPARPWLEPMLQEFGAQHCRDWVHGLGIETFVGSSQRVFPKEMKAAPLLRAWLQRLRSLQVQVHTRHQLESWSNDDAQVRLQFMHREAEVTVSAQACLLALGGASWPKLGSNGAWQAQLTSKNIATAPLQAANCGFSVANGWSPHLREKFAGHAIKSVRLQLAYPEGDAFDQQGEFVLTEQGIEGSLVYAASRQIREQINRVGSATVGLDLLVGKTQLQIQSALEARPSGRTLSNHLQKALALTPVKIALLYELLNRETMQSPAALAHALKHFSLTLSSPSPIDEAISCAGGVLSSSLTPGLMLRQTPGVFCAGEMLDWEAPTGGYLLTACLSSGRHAAHGIIDYLGL